MKKLTFILLLLVTIGYSQVGIGTNNPKEGAILDLNANNKGLLLPRVGLNTLTSTEPLITPHNANALEKGMMVYNINNVLGVGFYFWNGVKWVKFEESIGPAGGLWYVTGTSTFASAINHNIFHQGTTTIGTTTGSNVVSPGAILNLNTNNGGLLLPRVDLVTLTSTEPLITPNTPSSLEAGMLIYNTDSSMGEGIYYWSGSEWSLLYSRTSVAPMNALFSDNDTFSPGTGAADNPITMGAAPNLYLLECDYTNAADFTIINNPIAGFNFLSDTRGAHVFNSETGGVTTNNTSTNGLADLINFPPQVLGNTVTINLSLKYQQTTSNSESARIVAYASTNGTDYNIKIKDVFYRLSKTSTAFDYVRDEMVMSPIIITQDIVDYGLRVYIGNASTGSLDFYEPILALDYGSVGITL